jgi:carboxyl-terminal processing protease
MKITSLLVFVLVLLFSLNASADKSSSGLFTPSSPEKRDRLIGQLIKRTLEVYHYRHLKVDNAVSEKALGQFLKKIDYGKQFLLDVDVKAIEKFRYEFDDQLKTGDHKLIKLTSEMLKKRIVLLDGYRKEFFKKPFSYKSKESLELDPEKRDFLKTEKEMKDHWRKIFKQATLNRYLSLLESQKLMIENKGKKKDKKKKVVKKKNAKPEKILTDKEMRTKAHEAIDKKYKRVFARFQKEDHDDHLDRFINSISSVFDPHTTYLPPKKKEDFDIDISGSLEGIGAVLQEDGPHIKVVRIVPGGAAWRQKGLEVDDKIFLVTQENGDTADLVDMRVDDAVRYIRGPKGTTVTLTVQKVNGTKKQIPIVRDIIQIGASFAKSSVLKHKKLSSKIGYIHVPKFYRDFGNENGPNCSSDVRTELVRLMKENINGVILDLRNNGGGALEDARIMSGLFIEKGPIVQVSNHMKQLEVLKDTDPSVTYGGPLIVMTNRFSASASEILAGALQDYKRAVVVGGEYSHGKGTVQAVVNLNQGLGSFAPPIGALKVTIQKFYRITGVSTQNKGVTPDIIIPDPFSYTENREQDLEYSLPWDTVKPQEFKKWNKFSYDLPLLRERSSKRVDVDKRFEKIRKSVSYLKRRRKETNIPLNLAQVQKEDIENKKISESLKMDKENKDVLVTNFEASLRSHETIKKGEEAQWKKDFEQRKEEWVKGLQLDAGLEEALHILDDIIQSSKGKKLSMVKK